MAQFEKCNYLAEISLRPRETCMDYEYCKAN